MTQKSNMELWNKVCETDPKHTKKVTFGRGFTAIDPMWQVHNATQQFGPAGEGWGWEVVQTQFLPTNFVACLVRVWHGDPSTYVEQWGQCGLYIDKNDSKKDDDCMKKATTDGLTKCLSYFGFNADVFLGKFDDNKYVAEMEAKHKELTPEEKKANEYADNLIAEIEKLDSVEKIEAYKADIKKNFKENNLNKAHLAKIGTAFDKREQQLAA